jgi:hypothetical protein
MFRLSTRLPSRTARTHAACVSLSFFNDVKQRGGFLGPPVQCIGHKSMPVPFRVVPAASGQLHQEYTQGCWHRRAARVPQWPGLYVVLARGVKHIVAKICSRKNTVENLDFSSLARCNSRPCGGLRARVCGGTGPAALSPRLRQNLAWLTESKPSVAKLWEPAFRGDCERSNGADPAPIFALRRGTRQSG